MASETEQMKKQLREYLANFKSHKSLSFDGWSSKGHDEIYTISLTTPLRYSYLVDGLVLTGTTVSGENLFERIEAAIQPYDPRTISIVISDSAKNV
jgi:hypothetical protein